MHAYIYIKAVSTDKIVINIVQFYSLINFPFAFNIFPNQNFIPSIFPENLILFYTTT